MTAAGTSAGKDTTVPIWSESRRAFERREMKPWQYIFKVWHEIKTFPTPTTIRANKVKTLTIAAHYIFPDIIWQPHLRLIK